MLNIDIAVSSFWQLARHWKSGQAAKLELECEGGNLNLQLSARLGPPDNVHFPAPHSVPAQSSCKRKSPSQLRRQKRRQEEALLKADKAAPVEEATSNHSEKEVTEGIHTTPEQALATPEESLVKKPAEKPAKESLSFKCDHCDHRVSCNTKLRKHIITEHKENGPKYIPTTPTSFQCFQCNFKGASEKGLKQHIRMSHRISQVDGNSSDPEDNSPPEEVKSKHILDLLFESPPKEVSHSDAGVGTYHSKGTYYDDKTKEIKEALCYIFESGDIIAINSSFTAEPVGFTARRTRMES